MIRPALAVLTLAFAFAHLPFLASSLEDIDSVNFALGVRDFDVAEHRPHPPGYPVYIALGKVAAGAVRVVSDGHTQSAVEARALSIIALVAALGAIVAMFAALRALAGADVRALAAAALAASCPLFWYLAVRPMSDVPGLAAAWAALACLGLAWHRQRPDPSGDRRLTPDRMEASGRMIVLGALLCGIAIGVRSQNAVITLPFLAGVWLDRLGRGAAGALLGGGVAAAVGALLWAIPLVVASGGMNAYLEALGSQAGEDFAGVDMLYLDPGNVRLAAFALMRTLVLPWDSLLLGGVVVALSALGALALLMRERRTLAALILLAGPYLVFHLLFHDTTFVRYALPVVPVVALLAVAGLEVVARRAALPIVGALALWSVSIATPSLAAYGSEASPTRQALDAFGPAAAASPPGALAMHQTFQRPLQAEDVTVTPVLPSPPRREWLELARYWRDGHTAPVWFLADPRRTDLALVDPRSREDRSVFTWGWESLNDLGGMRPVAVHWYRLPPPGWFAEEGWALTPETAGIARLMGRGPSHGPIRAWIRRRPDAVHVLVGGRHLGTTGEAPVTFTMAIDERDLAEWEVHPGFFLRQFELPAGTLAGQGIAPLTIRAVSGQGGSTPPTAIEQFDVQSAGTLMWGYDEGWHEAEYAPAFGTWRWTSARASLRILNASAAVAVTFTLGSPLQSFATASRVQLRAADRVLAETTLADRELWRVVVPFDALQAADGVVTIETNQTFVPADTSGVPDRRSLGLRVFGVNVASDPLTVSNGSR